MIDAALWAMLIAGLLVTILAARVRWIAKIRQITDELADQRGGVDYTFDSTDAGYYGALDDIRAAAGIGPADRRSRQ